MRIITPDEFDVSIRDHLSAGDFSAVGAVTGPGRSGAVASVYASHILGVPFVPYRCPAPKHLGRLLIIDTARESGRTLRKAERLYKENDPIVLAVFEEPPRVAFWYEAPKPQRYRHEKPLRIVRAS